MVPEQVDRMRLGWSREDLARYSGVSIASIYLVERLGSATEADNERIHDALVRGLAQQGIEPSFRSPAADEATKDLDQPSGSNLSMGQVSPSRSAH